MPPNNKAPFKEVLRRYQRLKGRLPRIIGQEAVNFFKDNFTRQGWIDGGRVNKWKKRKPQRFGRGSSTRKRRALLIGTGRLRKSIRIVNWGQNFVNIGTDVKYAKIQNEGGIITQKVTPRQRAFFWRMFYTTGNEMYKSMALSKTIKIRIPKRKFMGSSTDLRRQIKRTIRLSILRAFKK